MITVHHLGVSQSERIVWLFEELGLPYKLQRYDRDPTTRLAPVNYKPLHPMGIALVITDGAKLLAQRAMWRRLTASVVRGCLTGARTDTPGSTGEMTQPRARTGGCVMVDLFLTVPNDTETPIRLNDLKL